MNRPLALVHTAAVLASVAAGRADAQSAPRVSLCPGMKIVTAVSQPDGDYESIKTIESMTDAGLRLKYSSERNVMDLLDGPTFKRQTSYRVVRAADAGSASSYLQTFSEHIQETVPGTTSIGTSAEVLRALKAGLDVEFGIFNAALVGQVSLNRDEHPNLYDYELRTLIRRVGAGTVTLPVLVDGQRVELRAVHAAGDFFGDKAEFFFLDDPANPLTLKFRIGISAISKEDADLLVGWNLKAGGDRDVLEVVKITTRCEGAAGNTSGGGGGAGGGAGGNDGTAALEEALEKTGRVEVYDIFFGFGSERIREESEPTLKRIGALLAKHSDWRLNIEGHTDNVASDAANLDLSKRRAAAVRKALVDRYGVAAARLATEGYGESRPKDTNDTAVGRARNRRVELVRR